MTVRKKKNRSAPVRIAPIILVAANSMASRTMESNTVPRIPASSALTILHKLSQHPRRKRAAETRIMARYTTAIPRSTHKNAVVRVIAAVILRKAAIIPIIRLVTTAITVQPGLQLLHDVDKKITSHIILCEMTSEVKSAKVRLINASVRVLKTGQSILHSDLFASVI